MATVGSRSWYVLSHNPVLRPKNIRCINTYIMNDGVSVFLFRDKAAARYVQKHYIPDHYVVDVDRDQIREYCMANRLWAEPKVVESLFCDIDSHIERFEISEELVGAAGGQR